MCKVATWLLLYLRSNEQKGNMTPKLECSFSPHPYVLETQIRSEISIFGNNEIKFLLGKWFGKIVIWSFLRFLLFPITGTQYKTKFFTHSLYGLKYGL